MSREQRLATASGQPAPGQTWHHPGAQDKDVIGDQGREPRRFGPATLQRAAVQADPGGEQAPPIIHEVIHSAGRPLDNVTRTVMESRLGHDFAQVRIHDDERAAKSARAVNALAYTVGNHIAFDTGRYQQSSADGQALLEHELVHTVQQAGLSAPTSNIQIGNANTPEETEAGSPKDFASPSSASVSPRVVSPRFTVARNKGKQKKFVVGTDDLAHLQSVLLEILGSVDENTRGTLVGRKTIAVGLVVDDDGDPHIVYTVNGNWTNKQLEAAAAKAGATRWEARPRAEGRGDVGAPGDAEQLMIGAADSNNFKVAAMAVSRRVCPDCKEAITAYDKKGIKVVQVAVPSPAKESKAPAGKAPAGKAPAGKAPAGKAPAGKAPAGKAPAGKAPAVGTLKGPKGNRPARSPSAGRMSGGRAAAGAAGGALVEAVLAMVARRYIQEDWDKQNEESFQRKLEGQAPEIERMIQEQAASIEKLQASGSPVFINVTLWVRYQDTDVGTAFMDLRVHRIEVTQTKLEHATESTPQQGFLESIAKSQVGTSERLLSFTLSYPEMENVSLPDPNALPPSPCFIATACYGSPLAPEVQVLRQFRDEWLQRWSIGRTFIRSYYAISPPIAAWLSRHEMPRSAVRHACVAPVVAMVRAEQFRWQLPRPLSGHQIAHEEGRSR